MDNPADICGYYRNICIREGDTVVDATAGNGHDTLLLAQAVGKAGRVTAFDIQAAALEHTRKRLLENGVLEQVTLVQASHEDMRRYVKAPVKGIFFNLGYLPGGDHTLATRPESTLAALEQSLALLAPEGVLCIVIYSGGDTGFSERDAVLSYLEKIDYKRYTVLLHRFYNRPNNPPMVAAVRRRK